MLPLSCLKQGVCKLIWQPFSPGGPSVSPDLVHAFELIWCRNHYSVATSWLARNKGKWFGKFLYAKLILTEAGNV